MRNHILVAFWQSFALKGALFPLSTLKKLVKSFPTDIFCFQDISKDRCVWNFPKLCLYQPRRYEYYFLKQRKGFYIQCVIIIQHRLQSLEWAPIFKTKWNFVTSEDDTFPYSLPQQEGFEQTSSNSLIQSTYLSIFFQDTSNFLNNIFYKAD